MKKYLLTFLIALIVGFFLATFFINQYNNYNGIKVSSDGEMLYFIQYGVFSNIKSMEENTISLENYIYMKEENLYYVYIGITKEKSNAEKIVNHYKKNGFNTIIKEYQIKNKKFIEEINNFDQILISTTDDTAISSLINQVLIRYDEVVINGG